MGDARLGCGYDVRLTQYPSDRSAHIAYAEDSYYGLVSIPHDPCRLLECRIYNM